MIESSPELAGTIKSVKKARHFMTAAPPQQAAELKKREPPKRIVMRNIESMNEDDISFMSSTESKVKRLDTEEDFASLR